MTVMENNLQNSSFNLLANISNDNVIIQVKRPFYGNVLKIILFGNNKVVLEPTKDIELIEILENPKVNLYKNVRQCLTSKFFDKDVSIKEFSAKIVCSEENGIISYKIDFNNYTINGNFTKE